MTPELRIEPLNDNPVNGGGDYVLYWMTSYRRLESNYALQRAVELANQLGKPLIVLEALRIGYKWASDRIHTFMIEGMADNQQAANGVVPYYCYLERNAGDGKGLIQAAAQHACAVVTDHFPAFMIPRMVSAAADQVDVRMEWVDSNGILPMAAADKTFSRAYDFRRFLQKNLPDHFGDMPESDPLSRLEHRGGTLPEEILKRWTMATAEELGNPASIVDALAIDHSVPPAIWSGGAAAGKARVKSFIDKTVELYTTDRNHPDADATSGLSPYLHFGFISAHQVFQALVQREGWSPEDVSEQTKGSREGWWNMSPEAESFLDELITWREVGFNMCYHEPETYMKYESLPGWARQTLEEHADDPRDYVYSLAEFEAGNTHDPIWNAAQNQLVREGRMHNYMRMLWGKKILHWTEHPKDALEIMIELNNKYALDGRDPNSYSGIFWVLGRYDRAWGPEREIFGKIRYMTSKSAKSKLRLNAYVEKYTSDQAQLL